MQSRLEVPLTKIAEGQGCEVVRLEPGSAERLRRLLALGLVPGAPVKVTRKWPAIVFKMGFAEFALDGELAGAVIVAAR